jgi:hypothetical protein
MRQSHAPPRPQNEGTEDSDCNEREIRENLRCKWHTFPASLVGERVVAGILTYRRQQKSQRTQRHENGD